MDFNLINISFVCNYKRRPEIEGFIQPEYLDSLRPQRLAPSPQTWISGGEHQCLPP